ncbi:gamma-glutamyl hydrolase-like protein, partial [Trifolium pratense]
MSKDTVLFLFFIAIFQCILSTKSHSGIILPTQLHHDSLVSSPVSCPSPDRNLYYQPVIGILSHPGDGASGRHSNATGASFIHASYVKFVEAAGARVVPLIYNEPSEMLLKKLELVNGVLFTGGSAKDGLYFETVGTIFK